MGTYASIAHVEARLGGREVLASGSVRPNQVEDMIAEAEQELLGTLAAYEIPAPAASSSGATILRGWVADYVSGVVRGSNAAAAGDGDNDDGQESRERWRNLLDKIERRPTIVSSMLNGGAADASTVQVRSHVTDTAGKTAADFTAVVTSTEVW